MRPLDPGRFSMAMLAALAGAAALAPRASGQALPRPLDEGIEDIDPLSTSLRLMAVDLRLDDGFQHVYQHPSDPSRFYRVAGGLAAVFPASDYVLTREGHVDAIVPPDTVFVIGGFSSFAPGSEPARGRPGSGAIVGAAMVTEPAGSPPSPEVAPGPVQLRADMDNELYRRERLAALHRRAQRELPAPAPSADG